MKHQITVCGTTGHLRLTITGNAAFVMPYLLKNWGRLSRYVGLAGPDRLSLDYTLLRRALGIDESQIDGGPFPVKVEAEANMNNRAAVREYIEAYIRENVEITSL